MAMTRADWDIFQTNREKVLDILKSNPGDYFSAKEIANCLQDELSCDLNPLQVGKVLSNGYKDGLVTRQYDGSQFTWSIAPAGEGWTPKPYDWRHAKGKDKPSTDVPAKETQLGTKSYADIRLAKIMDALDDTPMEEPTHAIWIPNEPSPTGAQKDNHMTTVQTTCSGSCANHAKASEAQETIEQEAERKRVHEAQVAREALIVALLGYSDEKLGADSGWKRLRRVSTYFGLDESYAE